MTSTPSAPPLTGLRAEIERIRVDLMNTLNVAQGLHVPGQKERIADAIHNALDLLKHHL